MLKIELEKKAKKLEIDLKAEKENTLDLLRFALNHPMSSHTVTSQSEILLDWERDLAKELNK